MEEMLKKLESLEQLKVQSARPGREAIEKQHQKGRLTARERVERLIDPGSFMELEPTARPISTGLDIDREAIRGDGIITGYGNVSGHPVCIWAQDGAVLGGRVGTIHGKKMVTLMERALRARVPCVGIFDSEGMRVEDILTTPTNYSYDRMMYWQTLASGVVPQVSLIMGPCLGVAALAAQLSDFVFMVRNTSYSCISTAPGILPEEAGNSWMHARNSGCCDVLAENEEDCLRKARELVSFLPSSNTEPSPLLETDDDPNRTDEELLSLVPTDPAKPYSMHRLISLIVDNGRFFEIKRYWSSNLVIGFARLGGRSVGIIANNPQSKGGCLDVDSADKMARFVRFCDAFNVPLLWLADTPAFLPAVDQEIKGIIRHGAKVVFSNSQASVPRVTVYVRKCYGGGNLAMPGNALGGDVGIAWPTSEIFLMHPEGAVAIIYRKEIEAAPNPEEELERRVKKFREESAVGTTWEAMTVQDYIDPRETRPRLIKLFNILANKKEERVPIRHDNVPL